MPKEFNKILIYVHEKKKCIKFPFTIYADLECLLKKINTFYNNLAESKGNLNA